MRIRERFNPRAPCGARRRRSAASEKALPFQPTRPLRGATTTHRKPLPVCFDFNPRAPCGARRSGKVVYHSQVRISTHAPLAGRDV